MDFFSEILYDKGMKPRVRLSLLFFSLLYITLYTPVFLAVYSPYWYSVNCSFHGRCDRVGKGRAITGIHELSSFYRHTGKGLVSAFWTDKEKKHLTEVRPIMDFLFFMGIASVVLFCLCYEASHIQRLALINTVIILLLILILPFFSYFWRRIFHPMFFNNLNWLNTPRDFSFYILPRVFFRNTLIFMVITSSLINVSVFVVHRYFRFQTKAPPPRADSS